MSGEKCFKKKKVQINKKKHYYNFSQKVKEKKKLKKRKVLGDEMSEVSFTNL